MALSSRTDDQGFNSLIENKNSRYSHIILELENRSILDGKWNLIHYTCILDFKKCKKNKFEKLKWR